MPGFIEPDQWETFLNEFSKRNQLRPTRLEIVGEIGDQDEEEHLPLVGVTFDPKGSAAGSVEIILGTETGAEKKKIGQHITKGGAPPPNPGREGLGRGWGFGAKGGGK